MLHEVYEDMDPDYRSKQFLSRKTLIGTIENSSLLPESGLSARNLLTHAQLKKIDKIRSKRLAGVMERFVRD